MKISPEQFLMFCIFFGVGLLGWELGAGPWQWFFGLPLLAALALFAVMALKIK